MAIGLTTIFTPPASCSLIITYDGQFFWQGGVLQTGDPDCYPASFYSVVDSFYSPGICPHGWTSASAVAGTGALVFGTTETNAICCPTGYFVGTGPLPNSYGLFCASLLNGVLTNVYSTSNPAEGAIPANPTLTSINVATVSQPTVWVDEIQVRWQATDTEILQLLSSETSSPSHTSTLKPAAASSSLPISTSAQTSTRGPTLSSTPPAAPPGEFSTGAKIAIGVVIPLAVIALIFGTFIIVRRNKRKAQRRSMYVEPKYTGYPQELDARYNERPLKGELDAGERRVTSRMPRNTSYELQG